MDHDGPGEGGIDGLDLFEELQHADGRERHSKVRPAGEVELGDRSGGLGGIASLLETKAPRLRMQLPVSTGPSSPQTSVETLTYWMQNLRMV